MKPTSSAVLLSLLALAPLSAPAGEMRFDYAVVRDGHRSAQGFHSDARGVSVRLRQPAYVYILAERELGLSVVYPAAGRPRPATALRPTELVHLADEADADSLLLVVATEPVEALEQALAGQEGAVPLTWLVEAMAPVSGTLVRHQERDGVSVRYEGEDAEAMVVEHLALPRRPRS